MTDPKVDIIISGSSNLSELILNSTSCNISSVEENSVTPQPEPQPEPEPEPEPEPQVDMSVSTEYLSTEGKLNVTVTNNSEKDAVGYNFQGEQRTYFRLAPITDIGDSITSGFGPFNIQGKDWHIAEGFDNTERAFKTNDQELLRNEIGLINDDVEGLGVVNDGRMIYHRALAAGESVTIELNVSKLDSGYYGAFADDGLYSGYPTGDDFPELIETTDANTNNVVVVNILYTDSSNNTILSGNDVFLDAERTSYDAGKVETTIIRPAGAVAQYGWYEVAIYEVTTDPSGLPMHLYNSAPGSPEYYDSPVSFQHSDGETYYLTDAIDLSAATTTGLTNLGYNADDIISDNFVFSQMGANGLAIDTNSEELTQKVSVQSNDFKLGTKYVIIGDPGNPNYPAGNTEGETNETTATTLANNYVLFETESEPLDPLGGNPTPGNAANFDAAFVLENTSYNNETNTISFERVGVEGDNNGNPIALSILKLSTTDVSMQNIADQNDDGSLFFNNKMSFEHTDGTKYWLNTAVDLSENVLFSQGLSAGVSGRWQMDIGNTVTTGSVEFTNVSDKFVSGEKYVLILDSPWDVDDYGGVAAGNNYPEDNETSPISLGNNYFIFSPSF